jgi:hypothetical protein
MPKSKTIDLRTYLALYKNAIEEGDDTRARELADVIEFGREPSEGKHLVRSIMGPLVEESKGTPFTCSVQSETYWCS